MIINMPYKVFISSLSLCVLFLSACTVLTVNPDPEEEKPITIVGTWDVVNSQDDAERYVFEGNGYGGHYFTYVTFTHYPEPGDWEVIAHTEFTYRFARDAGIPWRELSWEGISWENEIGTDIIIHHLEFGGDGYRITFRISSLTAEDLVLKNITTGSELHLARIH